MSWKIGMKHRPESNLKRSESIKRLYAEGKLMGFRSEGGRKGIYLSPRDYWTGKKLPYTVWNKGKKGLQVGWNKGMKFPERSGSKSSAWKGGITPLRMKIQCTDKWKNWVKTIMRRDDYRCVKCGANNNSLHVDHIVPYLSIRYKYNITNVKQALRCEELWDLNNGRVLCKECHKKTDTYLSKATTLLSKLKREQEKVIPSLPTRHRKSRAVK